MQILSFLLQRIVRLRNREASFGRNVRLEPSHLARGGKLIIGDNVAIRLGTVMMPAGGSIKIGPNTTINHYCVLHGGCGLSIGTRCLIAPRVSIFAANHAFRDKDTPISQQGMTSKGGIEIGDDVWIGTGAVILDGVQIGQGAIIGAGAVVTRSVKPFTIMAGNPAREIGKR